MCVHVCVCVCEHVHVPDNVGEACHCAQLFCRDGVMGHLEPSNANTTLCMCALAEKEWSRTVRQWNLLYTVQIKWARLRGVIRVRSVVVLMSMYLPLCALHSPMY